MERIYHFIIKNSYIILIIFLALLIRLAWTIVIPFNQAPDETTHYTQIKFMIDTLRIPILGPGQDLFINPPSIYYASMPGLNYILSSLLVIISNPGENYHVYIARLISVFSGLGVVFLSFLISRRLYPEKKYFIYLVTFFVAFLPQFVFVNSYVNIDAYTSFTTSLTLYILIKIYQDSFSFGNAILLGITLGMSALGKFNGYIIIPITALFLMVSKGNKVCIRYLTVGAVTSAFSSWWFIRSYYLYGDILGFKPIKYAVQFMSQNNIFNSVSLYKRGFSFYDLLVDTSWIDTSFKSFWGVFGWMNIWLNPIFYNVIIIFCGFAMLGLVIRFFEYIKHKLILNHTNKSDLIKKNRRIIIYIILGIMIFISIALSLYTSLYNDYQAQGRYFFPSLIPIIIFIIKGFDEIISKLGSKIYKYAYFTMFIGVFILNQCSYFYYLLKTYYVWKF
ncbi:MAG: ArnT family glycosyltransferase [Carboxydocellales bacterium]